jgi:hypothetical protein
MKVAKGLAILSFFSILLGSCFDPPEFPDSPEIVFEDIVFRDGGGNSRPDTLVLYIEFKDGNGDLGLDPQDNFFNEDPYHYGDFFQTNNGQLIRINSFVGGLTEVINGVTTTRQVNVLDIDDATLGKLAFPRLRKQPQYATVLPEFSCADYEPKEFIISADDVAVLDNFSTIRDTVYEGTQKFYLVFDSLYFEQNPNHYNITVDFLVKTDPNNPDPSLRFTEFDWRKEFCTTFDGRFPELSKTSTALDGTLIYAMESRGFKILFGDKILKLRIQIRDQELNASNIVESGEFTLNSIRKGS